MMRIAAVGLMALILAGSATAKDKEDPRISAVLSCTEISQPEARLQCFDSKMQAFRQAVVAGRLVAAEESTTPFALEGVVKSSSVSGFNRFLVVMDNGDRWELVANSSGDAPPRIGTKAKLRKGIMGNYWFVDPLASDRKASYRGRRI